CLPIERWCRASRAPSSARSRARRGARHRALGRRQMLKADDEPRLDRLSGLAARLRPGSSRQSPQSFDGLREATELKFCERSRRARLPPARTGPRVRAYTREIDSASSPLAHETKGATMTTINERAADHRNRPRSDLFRRAAVGVVVAIVGL